MNATRYLSFFYALDLLSLSMFIFAYNCGLWVRGLVGMINFLHVHFLPFVKAEILWS